MPNPKLSTGSLLTLKQVAEYCAVSIKTVRRWIARGEFPAHRLGSQWRVAPEDLELFLLRRRK